MAASFEAGRENAVVVVEPFPVVRVRLSPAPAEDERRARGQLVWSCDDEVRQIDVEESAQCGVYLLPGLQPGERYGFWLRRGAQHALVELDGSATEATATLREGRTIRGRILGFPLGEQVWVRATGPLGISESAYTDREGQFGFVGLPPGRWSLRAFVDERVARAEVEAGGTVDLLLEPPER